MEVKLLRAERRNRKIIIVFESNIYSNETFAVTPFYDEGDEKNKLQQIHFNLNVTEDNGEVYAKVDYKSAGSHFTKGHTQLSYPLSEYVIDKKDCAREWIKKERDEYFTSDRIRMILRSWGNDKIFIEELNILIKKKSDSIKLNKIKLIKERIHNDLKELDDIILDKNQEAE